MRSIALGAFLGQALLGSAVVGQQFTNTTTQIPVGSLNDQSYSGATSLPVGQGLYTTIIVNGQSTRVVVQSLGCKRVPAGVIPVTNSVTVAASSSSSCAAACLTTTRTTYAFFQNVCYCGTDVAPGLIDLPVSQCAASAPVSKMRRQTVNDIVTILRGFFANNVVPVLVGDNTAGLVSNLDQPFSVISTLNPGQAILATLLNSNGQQQRFRLESLGCRQLGVGESPFSDSFSPIAADAPTCVTTCLGNTYPLSSFIRNTCFCGTTVRATGAPVATLAQCQNPTPGNDFGTVIRASAFGPAPTTSTTSSSSSTSRSSSSSSSSTSSTSTSSTLTSTSSTSTSSTSTSTSLTTSASITAPSTSDDGGFPPETSTSSASPSSTASVNPANVGGFTYLGCYRSPSSFPTFTLTLSAEVMTNDRCIAACPAGKRYAATFGNDCFCGDFIDDVNEPKTPEEQCNIPCPGNSGQRCGGRFTGPAVKAKRQLPGVIASDIRFTIYVRVGAVISGTVSGAVTTVVTAVTTGTAANGVVTSGVVVVTTTVAAPGPWATGKWSNFPCFGDDCYKKIVAFGDYCGFDFPCFGPDCQRRLVWTNGVWRPEVCSGYDCGRKVKCVSGKCDFVTKASAEYDEKIICYGNVCKVEKCESDECNKKYVCKDNSCVFESCSKEEANKKYVYEGGKYTVVKECDGTCPKPQPPCEGDKCNVVIPQPPITTVTYNGSSYNTVVIPQPPVTKVPYQTAQPPAQTPVQPPANPPANPPAQPPASNGAQPPVASGAPGGGGAAAKPPVVPVVTAGTSKFAASFGALAFSVIAAAVLL